MQFVNILTLVILNKLRCHTHFCQPIKLLDQDCLYKFTYLWTYSADPDQLSSSEVSWSGSALFAKAGHIWVQQGQRKCICNNKIATRNRIFKLYITLKIVYISFCFVFIRISLTLKMPRKPASENVVCLCRLLNILANFSNLFCIQANSVDPDQTASSGAVWSGSTLFAKNNLKSQADDKADDNCCDWQFRVKQEKC